MKRMRFLTLFHNKSNIILVGLLYLIPAPVLSQVTFQQHQISDQTSGTQQHTLDISCYPSGIYIFRLVSYTNNASVKLISSIKIAI